LIVLRVSRLLCAVIFSACLLGVSVAADQELPGLKTGAKAPGFELTNQSGRPVKLAELLAKGPVALVFFRSAEW